MLNVHTKTQDGASKQFFSNQNKNYKLIIKHCIKSFDY